MSAHEILRHYLSALEFRFKHVLAGADDAFGDFGAGQGVRTPRELVRHMTGLMHFAHAQYGAAHPELGPLEWPAEQRRFLASLAELQATLARQLEPAGPLTLEQLWQGPLADAMTHVGQLAMLRRLSGSPVARLRYWQVVVS